MVRGRIIGVVSDGVGRGATATTTHPFVSNTCSPVRRREITMETSESSTLLLLIKACGSI